MVTAVVAVVVTAATDLKTHSPSARDGANCVGL